MPSLLSLGGPCVFTAVRTDFTCMFTPQVFKTATLSCKQQVDACKQAFVI